MTTTAAPPAQSVADAAAALERAAAHLAELVALGGLSGLHPSAVPEVAATVFRAADRASAVATMAAGVAHASATLPLGHTSTSRWLQDAVGLSAGEAAAVVARSSELAHHFPATGSAWLAGRVTGAEVRAITTGIETSLRAVPAVERSERRAEAEAILLELAERATVSEVRRAARRIKHLVDPEGAAQAVLDSYDDQRLRLTESGPGFLVDGYLSAETAAALLTALDQTIDSWHRAGTLPERDRVEGEGPVADRERRRRRPHLLAVALGHLAGRLLDTGSLGTRHDVRPHITLTVDVERLQAGIGGDLGLPGHDDPVPQPVASTGRMLCDATITAVVTRGCAGPGLPGLLGDPADAVLYVGRAHRTVPPRLRRALEVRDRHCAFPGCRVDPSRTQAHHVLPWEQGGPTDLDNLVLLCSRHHLSVHEGGWIVTAVGDSPGDPDYWFFAPPDDRLRSVEPQ
jgi:hypothetical protein